MKKYYSLTIFLLITTTLMYAKPTRRYKLPEEIVLAEDYKAITIDKTERIEDIIETELFGKPNFSSTMIISRLDGGICFSYHFYNVDEDNLCLGIQSFNESQNDAVIYVNTKQECGAKCKIYLDKPENKQIFYVWEPLKEIVTDKTKEKLVIKTNKKNYTVFVRTGIKELELFAPDFPKIKSIKGLEKFPNLVNLSLIGFDY
ncbi:MAG: hypothetical protein K5829_14950 [Treponema sp.]|nr:hypothetical protein [Treponema sp.]